MTSWDASLRGLGYHDYNSQGQHREETSVDQLMKNYMKQCLDYHQEQMAATTSDVVDHTPQFVPPSRAQESKHEETEAVPSTISFPVQKEVKEPQEANGMQQEQEVDVSVPDETIAKAKAIAQKFLLQQPKDRDNMTPEECRVRRENWVQKEQERFHKALLKNFEYIARREERRLKLQLAKIEEARRIEQDLEKQHALRLQQRQQMVVVHNKAGIGTGKRKRLEGFKKRKGHAAAAASTPDNSDTAALYLSSLPPSVEEETIHAVFGSYGTIRKVHFYRHKETQQLKGDGLLVYQLQKGISKSELLKSVCMQVSSNRWAKETIVCVERRKPSCPFFLFFLQTIFVGVRVHSFLFFVWSHSSHVPLHSTPSPPPFR